MTVALEIAAIVAIWAAFGAAHTAAASLKLKRRVVERLPVAAPYYRLAYNALAVVMFVVAISVAPKPDAIVYDLPTPYDFAVLAPQTAALVGLIWAAWGRSWSSFLGLKQAYQGLRGVYRERYDERYTLDVEGAYKISRHPIYLFVILTLAFRPVMSAFYLTTLLCFVAYFYVGSIFEERKLVELFGDEYRRYRERTSRIIPIKWIARGFRA
jgi:protein-S-isoprenylcysteine O-methyltransferase Ste14